MGKEYSHEQKIPDSATAPLLNRSFSQSHKYLHQVVLLAFFPAMLRRVPTLRQEGRAPLGGKLKCDSPHQSRKSSLGAVRVRPLPAFPSRRSRLRTRKQSFFLTTTRSKVIFLPKKKSSRIIRNVCINCSPSSVAGLFSLIFPISLTNYNQKCLAEFRSMALGIEFN